MYDWLDENRSRFPNIKITHFALFVVTTFGRIFTFFRFLLKMYTLRKEGVKIDFLEDISLRCHPLPPPPPKLKKGNDRLFFSLTL